MPADELAWMKNLLKTHDNAIFGDRDDPSTNPGIVSDLRIMRSEQAEMRATLMDVSSNIKKVVWLVIAMFITALGGVVYKGTDHPQSLSVTTSTVRTP